MKNSILIVTALVASSAVVPSLGVSPGLSFSLSETGFSFFGSDAVAIAIADAQTIPIPNVPEQEFDCLGHCYATVTGIDVKSLTCGHPTFKFAGSGNKVAASIPSCSASSKAHYQIKRHTFPKASCSGDVDVSISGFGISAAIAVGEVGGALKLSSATVQLGVSDISMHFSGSCKLLADAAKKLIEHAIEKQINDNMGPQISSSLNKALAGLHVPTSFSHGGLTVDATIPTEPTVTNTFLSVPVVGLVHPSQGPSPPLPPACPSLPAPGPTGSMVAVTLSPCVPDSAFASLNEMGLLKFVVNRTLLDQPVIITLEPPKTSPPTVTFTGAASATVNASFVATVDLPTLNGSVSLGVSLDLPATITVKSETLTAQIGNITMRDIRVQVLANGSSSGWDPLNGTQWAEFIAEAANEIAIPLANTILGKGFKIPVVEGVGLRDAVLAPSTNGVLVVTADFEKVGSGAEMGPAYGQNDQIDPVQRQGTTVRSRASGRRVVKVASD